MNAVERHHGELNRKKKWISQFNREVCDNDLYYNLPVKTIKSRLVYIDVHRDLIEIETDEIDLLGGRLYQFQWNDYMKEIARYRDKEFYVESVYQHNLDLSFDDLDTYIEFEGNENVFFKTMDNFKTHDETNYMSFNDTLYHLSDLNELFVFLMEIPKKEIKSTTEIKHKHDNKIKPKEKQSLTKDDMVKLLDVQLIKPVIENTNNIDPDTMKSSKNRTRKITFRNNRNHTLKRTSRKIKSNLIKINKKSALKDH